MGEKVLFELFLFFEFFQLVSSRPLPTAISQRYYGHFLDRSYGSLTPACVGPSGALLRLEGDLITARYRLFCIFSPYEEANESFRKT